MDENRGRYDRSKLRYPSDVTDEDGADRAAGGLMPLEMKRVKLLEEEKPGRRSSWPVFPPTGPCCRTWSAEHIKPTRARQLVDDLLTAYPDQDPTCLLCAPLCAVAQ